MPFLFFLLVNCELLVSWEQSPDQRVEGYLLEVRGDANFVEEYDVGSSSEVLWDELPENSAVYFRVRAYGRGLYSSYTAPVSWEQDSDSNALEVVEPNQEIVVASREPSVVVISEPVYVDEPNATPEDCGYTRFTNATSAEELTALLARLQKCFAEGAPGQN